LCVEGAALLVLKVTAAVALLNQRRNHPRRSETGSGVGAASSEG
jgi:hypothetical protein